MNIKFEKKAEEFVPFKALKPGDIFRLKGGEALWIKFIECSNMNAITLRGGITGYASENDLVEKDPNPRFISGLEEK